MSWQETCNLRSEGQITKYSARLPILAEPSRKCQIFLQYAKVPILEFISKMSFKV